MAVLINAQQISIHALLAESDTQTLRLLTAAAAFLSTLSLRRATKTSMAGRMTENDFYPRSPCGERRQWRRSVKLFHQFLSTLSLRRATYLAAWQSDYLYHFYPRSPCGERLILLLERLTGLLFLSTLSLRRATVDSVTQWTAL